jgi:hypothetical protein
MMVRQLESLKTPAPADKLKIVQLLSLVAKEFIRR